MPLFQQSVLKKYLNDLDQAALQKSYQLFTNLFHNSTKQENIRNAKEEQYQEGFLRELFVQVLGYTLNPEPDFNLTTEYKNEKDSKKADGAILKDGAVMGVIELKGTEITDLAKVETQAFGYKNNQKGCYYIITSNFEKIRFYINDAIDFEEFNLFLLTKGEFALLYLCLHKDNLLKDVPLKLKQASITEEENVTKKLYSDYSAFKKLLFQNITVQNPQYDKLLLFQKTQKLLDRFLFILFAEDRLLLPPNSIRVILSQWEKLKEMDAEQPLYSRFKLYFGYMNTGRTGKEHDIFAYNGGLFVPDEVLDNIVIDDDILYKSTFGLSNYSFETEVDVNILGHIFEHSLNEIEEVQSELEGKAVDKTKTRRKKDGVFYTPRYITKYIVENTVGTLCTQKKEELKIVDAAFTPEKRKANKKLLLEKLDTYRSWLLQLTICDPACGSGAFLNQALEFLITEHRYIDELRAKLFGDTLVLTDLENEILENNLYGVDINDEAIEIARLSLWLRTAKKGRKLSSLNNNIKCGNSLIDDPTIAGNKAFNWQEQFPAVFAKGGFDVVIGNPPYVPSKTIIEKEKNYYYSHYSTVEYQINTFTLFIEKVFSLIDKHGKYGLIVPNYFVSTRYDRALREKIFIEHGILEVLNVFNVFESATVDTLILIGQIKNKKNFRVKSISKNLKTISCRLDALSQNQLSVDKEIKVSELPNDYQVSFESEDIMLNGSLTLGTFLNFKKGMQPYEEGKGNPIQTREMMNNKIYHSNSKIDDTYIPLLTASSVKRHQIFWNQEYIKYGDNLAAKRDERIFREERILLNRILSKKKFDVSYIEDYFINNSDIFNIIKSNSSNVDISLKAISAIIGSSLCAYYFLIKNINLNRSAFPKVNVNTLETFPIPEMFKEQQRLLENKADIMLSKNKELQKIKQNLLQLLRSKYESIKLSNKLYDWPTLSFADFLKELSKQKIKLTLPEQSEWMQYFEQEKTKANALQQTITQTDKEIDAMVYALYGLTEDEIKIVEES